MSVELKVVLVGDDPQQQDAFNNPSSSASGPSIPPVQPAASQAPQVVQPPPVQYVERDSQEPSNEPSVEPTSPSQVVPPPIQSTQPTKQATVEAPPIQSVEPPPVQTDENRLIDSIDHLIESIDALSEVNSQRKREPSTTHAQKTESVGIFERFTSTIDRKLEEFGLAQSAVGNMVSNMAHSIANLGTRATNAASSVAAPFIGSMPAKAATTTEGAAAAGAATAGAEGAAGATAGAGVSASAAGAIAGPLIIVAAAAAASALSLKLFMDAVEKAAGELEDLSPQIAGVRAQHEVTMELARLDRAKRIGADVAGIEQARNRINESMYEVQTKIYELVLQASPVLVGVLNAVNVVARQIDFALQSVETGKALADKDKGNDMQAALDLATTVTGLANAINEFREVIPDMKNQRDPIFEELLNTEPAKKRPAPRKGNGLGGVP